MTAVTRTPGTEVHWLESGGGKRARRASLFLPTALLVISWALVHNFARLAVPPTGIDEPTYTTMGWRYLHWGSVSPTVRAHSNFRHPPLAKLLFGLAEDFAGHPSLTAARAVSATCTVGTGIVLAWWLGRAAGRWVGLVACAMVTLLPMTVMPLATSFGRTAFLDPVAELFMVCSLAAAWWWHRSSGRQSWVLATATGAATGLAAASKENGFLGAIGVVLLAVAWAARGERVGRAAQAGLAAVVSAAVFAASYLPLANPVNRIPFLFHFQWRQSEGGHLVGYAGRVSPHPAWWANLWFAWHGLGPWLGCVLLGTAAVAIAVRHDRVVAWCLAALAGPFVFHCFIAGNALPFYWVMWMPALFALSALGIGELAQRMAGATLPRPLRAPIAAALAATLGTLSSAAIAESVRVVTAPGVGASAVAAVRDRIGFSGEILTAGTYPAEFEPYLPAGMLHGALPADLAGFDTVVVGQPRCRTLIDPGIRALVQVNLAAGTLREVHTDRLVHVYVATGTLRLPTREQVDAQPLGRLSDHC